MKLRIDASDATPPYEQLCRQIVAATADGTLAVGTRLPSVRALADELGLAPGTVAKAYTQLEVAGVAEGRGRSGTFVRSGDSREAQAAQAAADFARRTAQLGLPAHHLLAIVRAALTQ